MIMSMQPSDDSEPWRPTRRCELAVETEATMIMDRFTTLAVHWLGTTSTCTAGVGPTRPLTLHSQPKLRLTRHYTF